MKHFKLLMTLALLLVPLSGIAQYWESGTTRTVPFYNYTSGNRHYSRSEMSYYVNVEEDGVLQFAWASVEAAKARYIGIFFNDTFMEDFNQQMGSFTDVAKGIYRIRLTGYPTDEKGYGGNVVFSYLYTPAAWKNDPESNDTWDKGTLLQSGGEQQGHLGYRQGNYTDTEDWYKIEVPDEGTVTFSTTTCVSATENLRLYYLGMHTPNDEGTNVNFRNDKNMDGGGKDTTVVYSVPDCAPGTYYVRLRRSSGHGSYKLKYTFTPNSHKADAPGNDVWNKPLDLALDTPTQGRLGYNYFNNTDTEDWYKIEVPADGKLTFLTKSEPTLRLYYLGMYTPNVEGTNVNFRNDKNMDGGGKDTTVVYEVPNVSSGTYYVRLRRTSGYGGYTLTCYFTSHADEADLEPNNDWKSAIALKSGPAVTGQLGYNYFNNTDTEDWYKIEVPKEGAAVFSMTAENTLRLYYLGLYTPNGDATNVNFRNDKNMDDGGEDITVTYTVPDLAPGTYYVRLRRSSGYGTYSLHYVFNPNAHENDPEPNDTWDKASLIENETTQEGCLGYNYFNNTDTEDWFKIEVPDEGTVTFSATAETTLRLYYLGFHTPTVDGKNVNFRNDKNIDGGGKDTTVVYTVDNCAPGTYYIRLRRSNGYGGYKLNYVFTPNSHGLDAYDNDAWNKATVIENGSTQQGRLGYDYFNSTDTEDWFKIDVPDEGTVTFSATAETTLRLYYLGFHTLNAEGTGVNFRNDKNVNAEGKDSTVVYAVDNCAPGTYYIRLRRSSGVGGYDLKYVFTPNIYGPDSFDNSTWDKAEELAIGYSKQGRLGYDYFNSTDTEDWYKIDVPYVGDLTFTTSSESALHLSYLGLHTPRADGTGVDFVADKNMDGAGKDTTVVYSINNRGAGTYYLRLRRSSGVGGYALKYNFERNPYDRENIQNGTFATRYQLEEGKLVSTTLGYTYRSQNNEDWYDLGMMHGRQIDVTIFPDTTRQLIIGVPALYVYEGDNEDGSPKLTKVAESRIERSQGTISYLDKNDADKHYVFRVPNYSSSSHGGYLILFGDELKEETPLIAKSSVNVMTEGRNTVRKGVPCENPITITNTSTEKTGAFILAITATDDVDILGFRLRGRYGSRYLPVDSVTTIGETDCENTLLFLVPSLNPWESYTFTMISEGEGDIAYAPIRSPHSTGLNKIVINGNTYVVVTAMGYVDEPAEGKKLSDYILKKVATVFGLDDAERSVLKKSIDLTVEELDAVKAETGIAVYGMKSVMKQVFAHITELLPGSEFAAQIERIDEMPCQLALPIRQRVFYWIYQDKNYMQDDIEIYDGKAAITDIVASWDPNEMVGPAGVGEKHYIGDVQTVNYRILFENKAEAGAPAYRIRISDELDENVFDVSSVRFGETSHNGVGYQWEMSRDGNKLSWDIKGIELPPNVNAPEGEGYVEFSVGLKPGLANGTQVKNKATIIFDKNTPIETNEFVNTIDIQAPVTTMAEAEYNYGDKVNVVCNTADEGAGVQSYLLFVSKDGGEYAYYGQSVTSTIPYPVATGEVATYSFYVLAMDNVGNVEEIIPQAVSVTGIKNVKVVSDPNASIKVYTIDGRYVGDSIQGLAKGVYVVGGRKMVIK